MAFNPAADLVAIQNILKADATLLELLGLNGKTQAEIVKRIIRKSKWDDLASNERRLCFFFRPDRGIPNLEFKKNIIEFNCHVPSTIDYIAYEVLARVHELIHKSTINNRTYYADGQLGELPTVSGFFCAGSRFSFCRKI